MTHRFRHLGRGLVLTAAALIGTATAASAAPMLITLGGQEYSDLSADVVFSYTGLTNSTGRIDVAVTNTSTQWDPRLTAFAFNLPGAVTGLTGFSSSLNGWDGDYDRNDIDTPGRLGLFDTAAQTGNNSNGGSPNYGIARNVTANFAFNLSGSNMLSLDELSFLNLFSFDAPGSPSENEQYFAARFQQVGRTGNGSDVAIPDGKPSSVPEPATLLLSGMGLLGAAVLRRRRA